MATKYLALDKNGNISYCSVPPELRGKVKGCTHIAHQLDGENPQEFCNRISEEQERLIKESKEKDNVSNLDTKPRKLYQKEINAYAKKLDEIAGCRVTIDNFKDVLKTLNADQIAEITKIGFKAAPEFSLPISDERYEDENIKNKLYFANLPAYGIGGNKDAVSQMFVKIGDTPTLDGMAHIDNSYEKGLTAEEYFLRQFSARDASINKSVATAKPGYTARKLFYCMADTQVVHDCGGPHIDALHCKMPEGHVCEKCANLSQGGETIHEGQLIGGLISTNISEALTQLSMKQKHVGSNEVSGQLHVSRDIMATLDGWGSSSIIAKMKEAQTTEEMRNILFEGLKEEYKSANIKQDDFNIMMVARKLTSYKRTPNGLRPVKDGEKASIVSMSVVGNYGNIFKTAELSSGYKTLTRPVEQDLGFDVSNQILR